MGRRTQHEFDAFVRDVGDRLLQTADLLTGDPARADRRVDRALARTYLKWRQATELDPTRIAHRALLSGYLDRWRPLPWKPQPPRTGRPIDADTDPDAARAEVLRSLDRLTRLERAATVLRSYARLDAFDTADALGVSEDAVLAASDRAARVLRSGAETVTWSAAADAERAVAGASRGDPTRASPPVSLGSGVLRLLGRATHKR
ncbi:hypothetical protein LO772_20790 [Yinghuangia sp. ASG 101]|uniref:hypothetical protein n=1 Tax=Yinghuangia sp. ASG 101 TaxID=2896848 RepID=UPI001E31504A|nr:hypothetical protein [Yinghuangia sp. ASG 101]UGQ09372.1 hypothetical protein LO772_20790 [Yinghuangia sp. ASG 101]